MIFTIIYNFIDQVGMVPANIYYDVRFLRGREQCRIIQNCSRTDSRTPSLEFHILFDFLYSEGSPFRNVFRLLSLTIKKIISILRNKSVGVETLSQKGVNKTQSSIFLSCLMSLLPKDFLFRTYLSSLELVLKRMFGGHKKCLRTSS